MLVIVFLTLGALLLVGGTFGVVYAFRNISRCSEAMFVACLGAAVVGAFLMLFTGLISFFGDAADRAERKNARDAQQLMSQAVSRQRELYGMIGGYSDTARDAITHSLSESLREHEWSLRLEESEIDGSVLLTIIDENEAELKRQLLRLPETVPLAPPAAG